MTTDQNAPMFANIHPGQPGYCYTVEGEAEHIRLVVRDGTGNLWTDRGHGGEPLARAVDDVLDLVPTRATYQALQVVFETRDAIIADLSDRLDRAEADVVRLKVELEDSRKESDDLDTKIVDLMQEIDRLKAEREKAKANYQFMVDRACDEKLDGYPEIGDKCAALTEERDAALAEVKRLKAEVAELRNPQKMLVWEVPWPTDAERAERDAQVIASLQGAHSALRGLEKKAEEIAGGEHWPEGGKG